MTEENDGKEEEKGKDIKRRRRRRREDRERPQGFQVTRLAAKLS